MFKVSVIIPAFNEEGTCRELLQQVYDQQIPGCEKELIIVESGSSDATPSIIREFEKKPGVRVIWQKQARGKGFAVREGLEAATGDILMIQDADLEYSVTDYPKLIAPIVEGRTNLVLGSRHMGNETWQFRSLASSTAAMNLFLNVGHQLFTFIFNLLFHQRTTDPTTMYKVFHRKCIEGLTFSACRFDFDFELLGKIVLAGHDPLELPVIYHSRGFAEGKKVQVLRDPLTWIRVLILTRLTSRRQPRATPYFKERMS
jgi:glycosyltransferase involved in cell wall biosynthesis